MSLTVLYQTRESNQTDSGKSYSISYYGTQPEIDEFISSLKIGTYSQQYDGYLSSITKSQYGGIFWQVDLEYSLQYGDGSFSTVSDTIVGKKSATLSVRNLQLPLERLPNYLTSWNHYLISCSPDYIVPAWAIETKTVIVPESDRENFRWIKSISELPLEKAENGNYWQIVVQPSKSGVEYYDYAVFVVTESAKYKSASDAGSAIEKNINKIISPENDFGLSGGDWKCDESNISYDGKYWIASTTYTKSGDSLGWDKDIYGE